MAVTLTPGRSSTGAGRLSVWILGAILGTIASSLLAAQTVVAPARPAPRAAAEHGVGWHSLKPAQQAALKPLEREWSAIDAPSKQKWLELSARFPKMTPAERERVQQRMTEWTNLTPAQRGEARLHYQEARQLPAEDRQARWNAYQALSPEQRQQLAAHKPSGAAARVDKSPRDTSQAKSNIVPNPAFAASPRAIAPTVVQARPGATTTLITKRPTPPSHQQAGLPKIAATPEFVNKATLLPRRGPQGAAIRPVPASASEAPLKR